MLNSRSIKAVVGYVVGVTIFIVIIPGGMYLSSVALDKFFPSLNILSYLTRIFFSSCLIIIGWIFAAWSLIDQYRIGKGGPVEFLSVEVSPKTKHLVVTGPYRYTRNPMLFGTCLFYYSIAVFLNSITALAGTTLFMTVMFAVVKLVEEKRLAKDFGDDYLEYKKQVSMFMPFPHKNR